MHDTAEVLQHSCIIAECYRKGRISMHMVTSIPQSANNTVCQPEYLHLFHTGYCKSSGSEDERKEQTDQNSDCAWTTDQTVARALLSAPVSVDFQLHLTVAAVPQQRYTQQVKFAGINMKGIFGIVLSVLANFPE